MMEYHATMAAAYLLLSLNVFLFALYLHKKDKLKLKALRLFYN